MLAACSAAIPFRTGGAMETCWGTRPGMGASAPISVGVGRSGRFPLWTLTFPALVIRQGGYFYPAAPTTAGVTLPSPFNVDMDGNTRGLDGLWDRGALEFGAMADTNPPTISGVQATTISDRSALIIWTTDESA